VYYLLGDHLGSTSLTANSSGGKVAELRYHPWGGKRFASGTTPTARRYTGQIEDAAIGLYFYNARYYDGALGRFIQADSIVPGAASGSGGSAATLGYDSSTRLTPLTVNLGEFAAQVNAENREVLQFGAFFQWDSKTRQEHNVPMGPANPQALNRYSYALNNPLRYVDPTGHFVALSVILVSGAIGGICSAGGTLIAQIAQGNGTLAERVQGVDWGDVGIAAGVGFVAGAAAPVVATTTAAAAILGATANVAQYGLTQWSNNESVTPGGVVINAAVGGITGGVITGPFNPQPGGKAIMVAGQQFTARQAAAENAGMQIWYGQLSKGNLLESAVSGVLDNGDLEKLWEDITK
jgi:RHS repeat-associated protein